MLAVICWLELEFFILFYVESGKDFIFPLKVDVFFLGFFILIKNLKRKLLRVNIIVINIVYISI